MPTANSIIHVLGRFPGKLDLVIVPKPNTP